MNQKTLGIVLAVVIVVGAVGYFTFVKKSEPIAQQTTPPPVQSQSTKQPTTTPKTSNSSKSQALSAINAAQDQVDELKKLIQSLETSKSSSLKPNNIFSFFISTANAESTTITIPQAKQSLATAEKSLEQARSAYASGNYNVAVSESRATQIVGITTHFQLVINGRGDDLKALNARAERWGNPQNDHPDLASAMQLATTYYETARTKMANLDLGNFKVNGNPTENVKVEPQIIDLHNSEDKAGGAINSAANLLDLIVNGPPSTTPGEPEPPTVSQ